VTIASGPIAAHSTEVPRVDSELTLGSNLSGGAMMLEGVASTVRGATWAEPSTAESCFWWDMFLERPLCGCWRKRRKIDHVERPTPD
jgi:hypothetical protein